MYAESAPSNVDRRGIGNQGIPRRAPQSLTEPVENTSGEHGRLRDGKQRPRERGHRIARKHERAPALQPVRPPSRRNAHQARGALSGPFDQADYRDGGSHDRCHEQRHDRIEHLGGGVGQKADEPENDDVARDARREPAPLLVRDQNVSRSPSWMRRAGSELVIRPNCALLFTP